MLDMLCNEVIHDSYSLNPSISNNKRYRSEILLMTRRASDLSNVCKNVVYV